MKGILILLLYILLTDIFLIKNKPRMVEKTWADTVLTESLEINKNDARNVPGLQ